MRTVTFRPIRRIKKTGKIVVASYSQWRKVMTADYSDFNLIVENEYNSMPLDERVHDDKGELLYFPTYNPADVPVFRYNKITFDLDYIHGIQWNKTGHTNYHMLACDCDGVPCFNHFTQDYLATHYTDMTEWEPLTVATVRKWFGLFLFQLEKSNLKIGK